ncbi:MAG: hypothetical protein AAB410_02060 [Patescibacteria group bacterium]
MTDQAKIEKIIYLIEHSGLDPTIQEILIRDLKTEGLTDFLKEQIHVYCVQGLKILDEKMNSAVRDLENKKQDNSSQAV